jgi:hypothetical protein
MSPRSPSSGQDGFLLMEIIMAAALSIVLVLAISATLGKALFFSKGHQSQAAGLAIAQREIENAHKLVAQHGFDALALSGQPDAPSDGPLARNPDNPNDLITAYGTSQQAYLVEKDFRDTTQGPQATERLIIGASSAYPTPGTVAPITTNVTSGALTATVYRYVTEHNEACATAGACTGDSRRVIIAVVPTVPDGIELQSRKPVYVMTVIDNPAPESARSGSGLRIGANIS